jgi:hypothetical protein
MDKRSDVFIPDLPNVAANSPLPSPILDVSTLIKNITRIQPRGAWGKGGFGGWTLPLFISDGVSGPRRSAWIQVTGFSDYGLSLFDETKVKNTKYQRKERTDGKTSGQKSWDLQFNVDHAQSLEVEALNKAINAACKSIIEEQKKVLSSMLNPESPDEELTWIQRPLAKPTASSSIRQFRIPYWPQRMNCKNESGKDISFDEFPARMKGSYLAVFDLNGIDASWDPKNKSITYGPIVYGKILQLREQYIPKAIVIQESEKIDVLPTEEELEATLEASLAEKEKQRKEKERERKEKEKEEKAKKKKKQKV